MSSPADKAAHELAVILEFAKAAKLGLDASTLQSRPPPEPDVRCGVHGELVYFELGRLLDRDMQRARVSLLTNPTKQVSSADYRVGLPERDVLRKKLASHYETFGAPLELLLYFDADNWLVSGGPPPFDFEYHARHVMLPYLEDMRSPLRRVWVFDRYHQTVLWRHQRESTPNPSVEARPNGIGPRGT